MNPKAPKRPADWVCNTPARSGVSPLAVVVVAFNGCGCAWEWAVDGDQLTAGLMKRSIPASEVPAMFDRTAACHLVREGDSVRIRPACRLQN